MGSDRLVAHELMGYPEVGGDFADLPRVPARVQGSEIDHLQAHAYFLGNPVGIGSASGHLLPQGIAAGRDISP
jgi:hypothetical protein